MVNNLQNLCHVSISIKLCVLRQKIMRQKVSITDIFVRLDGILIIKHIHIPSWTAEGQRQKTNESGHVEYSSSCPEN